MAKVLKPIEMGIDTNAGSEDLLVIEGVSSLKELANQLNQAGKNSHDWEKVFSGVKRALKVALGTETGKMFVAQPISKGSVSITYLTPESSLHDFEKGDTTELEAIYLDHCSGQVHDHTKRFDLEVSGGTPEQALSIIRYLVQKSVHPVDLMDGAVKKTERGFEFNGIIISS
ncbi:MAG: hypothetical protein AB7J40_00690 [Candidatus Altimarinota bacterium]